MEVTRIEKRKLSKGKMSLKCNICPKEFAYKYLLNHHIREIHEKIRSFSCDICSKVVCPICAHAFSRGTYLKRHIEENTRLHERYENFKLFNLD